MPLFALKNAKDFVSPTIKSDFDAISTAIVVSELINMDNDATNEGTSAAVAQT